jgi:hypothetical protein
MRDGSTVVQFVFHRHEAMPLHAALTRLFQGYGVRLSDLE